MRQRAAGAGANGWRGALGVVALALCAAAGAGAPGARADASKCTSQTLMQATGALATEGYSCGYLDNWEEHSIGGWATQFWSSYPALAYKYDYICDHQTGDVDLFKVTTQGEVQMVNGAPVPVAAGSLTYTASNSATSTRHWAAGVIWSTANPEDGPLAAPGNPVDPPDPNAANAYTKSCGSGPAGDIPSYVLYQATLNLTSSPDGSSVPAGV
ncbi:MAG: hypothetical protein JWM73_1374, partial [Solirubrobacterales bacterium]|nr:hypothetical protein [Solirubrobacterales bacterium]